MGRKAHVPNVTPRVFASAPPPSLVIPPWLPCHSRLGTTTFWQNSPNCSPPHSPFASDFLFANHAFFLLSRIRQLEQTSLRGNLIVSISILYGGEWVTRPPDTNWRAPWSDQLVNWHKYNWKNRRNASEKLKEIQLIHREKYRISLWASVCGGWVTRPLDTNWSA